LRTLIISAIAIAIAITIAIALPVVPAHADDASV